MIMGTDTLTKFELILETGECLCTALGTYMRAFPDSVNWGEKTRPECRWHHLRGWDPCQHKGGKGRKPAKSSASPPFFSWLLCHLCHAGQLDSQKQSTKRAPRNLFCPVVIASAHWVALAIPHNDQQKLSYRQLGYKGLDILSMAPVLQLLSPNRDSLRP